MMMQRFSQNLEQDYILEYFDKCNRSITPPRWITSGRKLTFLDIGANSGVHLSNTFALAMRGAVGVLVEPSPKAFAQLKENYKGLTEFHLYNVALGDRDDLAVLQESGSLLSYSDVGLVSTFDPSEMERFKSICTYEPVTVQMYKWETFYSEILVLKHFDLISLDIENYEMHVLPYIDLSETSMLVIEHNGSQEKKKQYLECTSKYGIDKIIYESAENIVIVR